MRLAQALLFVTDLPRMQAFYTSVLGLAVLDATDGFVRLDGGGGVALALHAIPPEISGPIASPPVPREDTWTKLCFHVDDIDAARAALVAAGVPMRDLHRWQSIAYCDGIDPEGNVFQITTR